MVAARSHYGDPATWPQLGYKPMQPGTSWPAAAPVVPTPTGIEDVADSYDVMTSRDSYRTPISSEDAVAELKRVAGRQLDPAVVSVFTALLHAKGLRFRHGDDADFDAELAGASPR